MKNIYEIMNAVQELFGDSEEFQAKLRAAQDLAGNPEEFLPELKTVEVTGESGAGMAKVTLNGLHEMINLTIDPQIFDENGPDFIRDLVMAAHNDATQKLEPAINSKRDEIYQRFGSTSLSTKS